MKGILYVVLIVGLALAAAGASLAKIHPAVEGFIFAAFVFSLVFPEHSVEGWVSAKKGSFLSHGTFVITMTALCILLVVWLLPGNIKNFAWYAILFMGVIGVTFSIVVLIISNFTKGASS